LPIAIIIVSGVILQLKKEVAYIQPSCPAIAHVIRYDENSIRLPSHPTSAAPGWQTRAAWDRQ